MTSTTDTWRTSAGFVAAGAVYAYLVWKTKKDQYVPPDSGGDETALVKLGKEIMGQNK
jgi:hypothetical protein